jgi:hypothetical protein
LWREVADGLRFVWRVPILRAVLIQAPLVNFSFSGVIFTITLALRQHGTSTVLIGLVQAAIALAGAADRRPARPASVRPRGDRGFRRRDGHRGGVVPDSAGLAKRPLRPRIRTR